MKQPEATTHSYRTSRLPRLVGMLWGSTNPGDIFQVLQYLTVRRSQLVDGPVMPVYEREFAQRVNTRHAISFASGRLAMYALLREMGVRPGDEVLIQVPTHIVVANAIRYVGALPVYVDCDLNTYNMDLAQAEERITPRTRVLLVQHTFGIPVDMDAAVDLARRHNLILIEDCVHALGATYKGQPVGSFGEAAFFSTEETKIISSTMGGMAVTNDDALAARLRAFREQCQKPAAPLVARYLAKLMVYHLMTHPLLHKFTRPIYMFLRKYPSTHMAPGATSEAETRGREPEDMDEHYLMRMGDGQAAIALRQLRRLDSNLAHRRAVAEHYRSEFARLGFHVPTPPEDAQPSWVRFPLLVKNRAEAMRKAMPAVALGQWFNTVLEESETPEAGGYPAGTCPRAEFAARHLVNVPTHQRVHEAEIEGILAVMARIAPQTELPQPVSAPFDPHPDQVDLPAYEVQDRGR